jgi:hypothetical protein
MLFNITLTYSFYFISIPSSFNPLYGHLSGLLLLQVDRPFNSLLGSLKLQIFSFFLFLFFFPQPHIIIGQRHKEPIHQKPTGITRQINDPERLPLVNGK